MSAAEKEIKQFMKGLAQKNPGQIEFYQAVEEVMATIIPFALDHNIYIENNILERIVEPDRTVTFRVTWEDDKGKIRVNRGMRIQFNNAIGPYKGGLRFHPSINESILKFLAFEQIFKNSLTTLPMGAGKGGADFDPKGKSDREVMRFCQAFMTELAKHIGKDVDVPAGDIGVGTREIGYLFGKYKKLHNEFTGVITGKGLSFGGSRGRLEATGYGCVFFAEEMLQRNGDNIKGKKCNISGSGNVAIYTAEKILQLGGTVHTMSDSSGFIYDPQGINEEKLAYIKTLKEVKRGRISEYTDKFDASFYANQKPWSMPCDIAFPSATQNEILGPDAQDLIKNGCKLVAEGANMPSNIDAIELFHKAKILYAPGKAANAGGVAVSGLEMAQNSMRSYWTKEETEAKLKDIMKKIHEQCVEYGKEENQYINYVKGANIAGFVKVADAMVAFGIV